MIAMEINAALRNAGGKGGLRNTADEIAPKNERPMRFYDWVVKVGFTEIQTNAGGSFFLLYAGHRSVIQIAPKMGDATSNMEASRSFRPKRRRPSAAPKMGKHAPRRTPPPRRYRARQLPSGALQIGIGLFD